MRQILPIFFPALVVIGCESKNFGTLDYIREDLKSFCSKKKIVERHGDGKVVFQFADPETDRMFSIFVRPEGDPVEEIYLLWNRKYGTDNEDKAFSCALNYIVMHLCGAGLESAFRARKRAEEIEALNEMGREKFVSEWHGNCFISFVSRGNRELVFLTTKP